MFGDSPPRLLDLLVRAPESRTPVLGRFAPGNLVSEVLHRIRRLRCGRGHGADPAAVLGRAQEPPPSCPCTGPSLETASTHFPAFVGNVHRQGKNSPRSRPRRKRLLDRAAGTDGAMSMPSGSDTAPTRSRGIFRRQLRRFLNQRRTRCPNNSRRDEMLRENGERHGFRGFDREHVREFFFGRVTGFQIAGRWTHGRSDQFVSDSGRIAANSLKSCGFNPIETISRDFTASRHDQVN